MTGHITLCHKCLLASSWCVSHYHECSNGASFAFPLEAAVDEPADFEDTADHARYSLEILLQQLAAGCDPTERNYIKEKRIISEPLGNQTG